MFTSIGSTPREDTGKAPKKGQKSLRVGRDGYESLCHRHRALGQPRVARGLRRWGFGPRAFLGVEGLGV